jgi:hypothetical protein
MNIQTFNKGEWSELYAFLKILADGNLFGSDYKLNKLNKKKIKVIYIKQESKKSNDNLFYHINTNDISIKNNDEEITRKEIKDFKNKADEVLKKIKETNKTTFTMACINDFFKEIGEPKLKSSSSSKRDITISIYDCFTNQNLEYGFSIKSNLAGKSTLLNSSSATNFLYKVENYKEKTTSKSKELLNELLNEKAKIIYSGMDSKIYNYNLQLIDTVLPEIISNILIYYYSKAAKDIKEIIKLLEKNNPMKYPDTSIYNKKIADFLVITALGMLPNTKWDGLYDVDGGTIVIKKDGGLVTFFVFQKFFMKEFRKYLINNSFLDTPSTTRHKFGSLFKDNTDNLIKLKLNLQIRLN